MKWTKNYWEYIEDLNVTIYSPQRIDMHQIKQESVGNRVNTNFYIQLISLKILSKYFLC